MIFLIRHDWVMLRRIGRKKTFGSVLSLFPLFERLDGCVQMIIFIPNA